MERCLGYFLSFVTMDSVSVSSASCKHYLIFFASVPLNEIIRIGISEPKSECVCGFGNVAQFSFIEVAPLCILVTLDMNTCFSAAFPAEYTIRLWDLDKTQCINGVSVYFYLHVFNSE